MATLSCVVNCSSWPINLSLVRANSLLIAERVVTMSLYVVSEFAKFSKAVPIKMVECWNILIVDSK